MFALQVNSNFFWMFKALLGLSTKGTLKTLTLATSVASLVSLPMVMVVSLVVPCLTGDRLRWRWSPERHNTGP